MIDLIKKTILAGIGATVVTKEKIEASLQDFVKQGKVTADEARHLASKVVEDGRKEWDTTSKELNERFNELIAKADYARKSEVAALTDRVAALEAKVAALSPKEPGQ